MLLVQVFFYYIHVRCGVWLLDSICFSIVYKVQTVYEGPINGKYEYCYFFNIWQFTSKTYTDNTQHTQQMHILVREIHLV